MTSDTPIIAQERDSVNYLRPDDEWDDAYIEQLEWRRQCCMKVIHDRSLPMIVRFFYTILDMVAMEAGTLPAPLDIPALIEEFNIRPARKGGSGWIPALIERGYIRQLSGTGGTTFRLFWLDASPEGGPR